MRGRGDLAMKFYDALNPAKRNDRIEIRVSNPKGVMKGVKEIRLDDAVVDRIVPQAAGSKHTVDIIMGAE